MSIRTSLFAAVASITAFGATTAITSTAHANPCESQWMKLDDAFRKLSPIVSTVICKQLNKDDAAAAQQCLDDYEKKKAEIEKVVNDYNEDAGSEKIGPRGLGWGAENPSGSFSFSTRIYDGNLLAERTFISAPVTGENIKFAFRGTGGKSKQAFSVTVCVLDEAGALDRDSQEHSFATNEGRWDLTLTSVSQKRVMVYLKNSKVTLDGHKYELSATPSGVPAEVLQAKDTLAKKVAPAPVPIGTGKKVVPIGK